MHPTKLYSNTRRSLQLASPIIMILIPLYPNPNFTLLHPTLNMKSPPSQTKSILINNNNNINSNFPNYPFFSNPKITLSNSLRINRCFSEATNCNTTNLEEAILIVVSFYKFADFPDHAELRKPLKELCQRLRISGGIILAPEGINGSICGTRDSVEKVLAFIQTDDRFQGLRRVESPVSPEEEAIHHGHSSSSPLSAGEDAPFRWDHVRVKLKKEIVTLGMPEVSPIERVGKYVSPYEWNDLITDPDTVVIDVRNGYETRIGKFKGAVDPCTSAFRHFPSWVEERFNLPEERNNLACSSEISKNESERTGNKKPPRVAMYCTGGIRCEKATSLLISKGFNEVYHLQGGILKYLEEVPKEKSLWEGECFVFDKRVSVEHGLVQGTFKLCYGCKQPVSDADMESREYEYGVCCPYCYSSKSDEEKERARARQKQFERWGIIGGPDKGRKPVGTAGVDERSSEQSPQQMSTLM